MSFDEVTVLERGSLDDRQARWLRPAPLDAQAFLSVLSAISTGLVDITVRPSQILGCLKNFFERAHSALLEEANDASDHMEKMCEALREAVGHDFRGYKRSTLSRRIARRMQVLGIQSSADYLA